MDAPCVSQQMGGQTLRDTSPSLAVETFVSLTMDIFPLYRKEDGTIGVATAKADTCK